MKNLYLLSLTLIFSLLSFSGQAQSYKLSKDAPQFLTDLKVMLASTKQEAAIKVGTDMETAWNSGRISDKQKDQIIEVAQKMLRKKMRPRPQFENYFGMLEGAVNGHQYTGATLDQLLRVADKAVEAEEPKSFDRFLSTANLFLHSRMLFSSTFSRVRVVGGTFSFGFTEGQATNRSDGWGSSDEKKPDDKKADDKKDDWGVWATDPAANDDGWGTVTDTKAKKTKEKTVVAPVPAYYVEPLPVVPGPALLIQGADLVLITPYDSVVIRQTEGAHALSLNTWLGKSGNYAWSVKNNPISVQLKEYILDVTKTGFKAEGAMLEYPVMLESPIAGVFEFRSKKRNVQGQSDYPRFMSFTNNAKIKNIGENIQYLGGFSLAGTKVMSAALDGASSVITVAMNGERKFKSRAQSYEIGDSLILSQRAAVVIYQNKDSITHPALQFKYLKPKKELTLVRDNGRFRNTPFFDSYHQMEIVSEIVTWDLSTAQVHFGMLNAKDQIPARFESKEYYTDAKYQQLKGINSFHPLKMIVTYAQRTKTDEFYAEEMARDVKIREAAVKSSMAHLASEGYIEYDPTSGYVKLKDKAKHYVSSSLEKKDYDHILLNSVSKAGKNATLDLNNNELVVRGIERFYFSADSNSVYVQPDSGQVRVLQNRDLRFNGKIYAGNFILKGQDFRFDYNKFYIDLVKIDSTIFAVKQTKKLKQGEKAPPEVAIVTKQGKSTGKLYLNKPDNKSGKVKNLGYPRYNAESGGYVYFNKPEVLGGVYDTSVYFIIPPFVVDSMTTARGSIGFDGEFHSGGIFTPIKTKLSQMPDNSLGFNYQVPKNGIQAYGGKGVFYESIQLDFKGLRGKGEVKYLTTTLQSEDFVFYPDSVTTAVGTTARIEEAKAGAPVYPAGSLDKYRLVWKAKQDSMSLRPLDQPLKLYKDQYTFKGLATVTPGGLYGQGQAEGPEMKMESPQFLFQQKGLTAKKAGLEIKSKNPNKPALKTQDVVLSVDLEKGLANYLPEQAENARTELPYSQYNTSLSAGKWDMNKKKVEMYEPAAQQARRAYFYSTHPDQDSLHFPAKSGSYDLNRFSLIVDGVPFIAVADTYISPDSNRVYIAENANMRTFKNAQVLMDTVNKFHNLYQGEVQVKSRNTFVGQAQLDFKNASGQSFPLKFGTFTTASLTPERKKDKAVLYTRGEAKIEDKSEFYIAPRIRFYGDVALSANKQHLDFNGFVKIGLTKAADSDWFPYTNTVNPEDVRIKIENPVAVDGTPLTTGLHVSLANGALYHTFAAKKKDEQDPDIFRVQGLLSFDKAKRAFKIGSEEKAYGQAYQGNVMTFNDSTSTVTFEGKVNLIEPTKHFNIESAGTGAGRLDSGLFHLNALMAFDIDVPEQAWAAMGDKMAEHTQGLAQANASGSELHYKLAEFIGEKGVKDYIAKSSTGYVPLSKVSAKLQRSLVLSEVQLRWSPQTKAWYSVGKIGLAGVGKKDLNAMVDGYIEIKKGLHGDAVVVYIEAKPSVWYYLSLNENALALASTDGKFEDIIRSKSKGDNTTTTNYTFYPVESMERLQFVNYFRKTYLNLKPIMDEPLVRNFDTGGGFEDASEEGGKKSKKKKKKSGFPEMDASDQGQGGFEEAQPEKTKTKKSKKGGFPEVENTGDAGDNLDAEPAEKPAKKAKKGKQKEPEPDVEW